jgi:hypothetical protein
VEHHQNARAKKFVHFSTTNGIGCRSKMAVRFGETLHRWGLLACYIIPHVTLEFLAEVFKAEADFASDCNLSSTRARISHRNNPYAACEIYRPRINESTRVIFPPDAMPAGHQSVMARQPLKLFPKASDQTQIAPIFPLPSSKAQPILHSSVPCLARFI